VKSIFVIPFIVLQGFLNMCGCDETATRTRYFFKSLYLRAFVSTSSFSKSLRRDLKIFLGFSPVLSAISWRVNSPSFSASTTSWSVLLSFTMAGGHLVGLCLMACGAFQFCGKPHCCAHGSLYPLVVLAVCVLNPVLCSGFEAGFSRVFFCRELS
jgi:hypothetical protein